MNDRIRQLAVQANGPNPFFGTLKNQMALLGDDAVEKFAELLVRECVGIARQNNNSGEGGVIAQTIEQHFGVK